MAIKFCLGLVLSLLLSGNAMAQSNSGGQSGQHGSQANQGHHGGPGPHRGHGRPDRPSVKSVPELDGSMAFLALGLTFAVGALIREKRRTK
jgi:hypothetical protein